MALANSAALRLAGISAATPDVAGGAIVRDAAGVPTGVLKDNAMRLVERAVPPPSPADEDAALDAAMTYVTAQGVTSIHHMGSLPPGETWHELEVFCRARDRGALRVRIHSTVPLETWPRLATLVASGAFGGADGRGDDWVRIGSLKSFVDGSLGARTAAFHEAYADRPGDCGLLVNDPDQLRAWMIDADAAGLQLTTHAIGDRANTLLLDLLTDARAREWPARSAIPGRARTASARGRRPAVRRPGRDRQHAAVSRGGRRPLGRARDRARAHASELRVAVHLDRRRTAGVRQRLVRGAGDAARGDRRGRQSPHARRTPSGRLDPGRTDRARPGAPRVHDGRGTCGLRGGSQGTAGAGPAGRRHGDRSRSLRQSD